MSTEEASQLKRATTIILLVLLAGLLFTRLLYLYLDDNTRFPINTIKVIASYQHITHEQLKTIFERYQQNSFYTLPVHQLYNKLTSLPWVATVDIKRIFPDTIQITLTEKVPFALWHHHILTAEGNHFSDPTALATLSSLPHFVSMPQDIPVLLHMYQKMSKILALNQLSIKRLEWRENHAWDVTLTNGILLKLGKQDPCERMARFSQAYPILSAQPGQLERVDLRYPKGMAAKWRT